MSTESDIKKLGKRKEDYLLNAEKKMQRQVTSLEKTLLGIIYEDYIGKFDTVEGSLTTSAKNIRLVAEMDLLFDTFALNYQNVVISDFGASLASLTPLTNAYYKDMGVKAGTLKNISEKAGFIDKSLGLKNGKILPGSYLDRLGQSQEVRQLLKDYVTSSLVEGKGITSFTKGFKDLVQGSKEVDGALTGYYKQYAYDTYNQVEAAKNAFFAKEVGFDYFFYRGTIIKTSRDFCIKRAGKVFSIEEATTTWQCDPTLLKRKGVGDCDDSYNALVERGRWNCRHQLDYVDKTVAESLGISTINI